LGVPYRKYNGPQNPILIINAPILSVLPKAQRQAEKEVKRQEAEAKKLEEAKKKEAENPKRSVCSVGV